MVAPGMVVGDVVADFRRGVGHAREIPPAASFGSEAAAVYWLPQPGRPTRPPVADARPARGAGPRWPGPRACPRQRLRASSGRASWTDRARPPPWQVRDVAHPRPVRAVGAAWPCRVRPSQRLGAELHAHGRVRVGGAPAAPGRALRCHFPAQTAGAAGGRRSSKFVANSCLGPSQETENTGLG